MEGFCLGPNGIGNGSEGGLDNDVAESGEADDPFFFGIEGELLMKCGFFCRRAVGHQKHPVRHQNEVIAEAKNVAQDPECLLLHLHHGALAAVAKNSLPPDGQSPPIPWSGGAQRFIASVLGPVHQYDNRAALGRQQMGQKKAGRSRPRPWNFGKTAKPA